jgi:hypothetical protein
MAAMATTNAEQSVVCGTGKNLVVLTGKGRIPAADTTATLNVKGKISRVTNIQCTGITLFEVVVPTTEQPASGVLTFERDNAGADLDFWYRIEGF